jgi:hypothetical protein
MQDLYALTKYSNIVTDVYGMYLPFDQTWQKIAVAVSGGADSAMLAFLLCSLIERENLTTETHVISNIRTWKTKPWHECHSDQVYNSLTSTFKKIKFIRHKNFVPPELEWGTAGPQLVDEYGKQVSGDNIELRAFSEYVCFKNNIDAYYNAVTKNPSNIKDGVPNRYIEPSKENIHMLIMEHMNKLAIHPFRFTTKDQIIKLYYDLKLDSLLNLTRSCEGEFEELNYKTYTPGQYVPVCGTCFWCKEREWAIEQNK